MIIYTLVALVIAVIVHEVAHGYVAYRLGDPTAKSQGRLSLNPIPHIDLLGSIILPLLCLMTGGAFFLAWAKPVPVNPNYFASPVRDMMWVALAGPISNLLLAYVAGVALHLGLTLDFPSVFMTFCYVFVYINVVLALFNMLPVPPLDGSRVLAWFLPSSLRSFLYRAEPYGIAVVFALVYFGLVSTYLKVFFPPLLRFFVPGELL
jgi:Zn-dependent protease